MEQKQVKERRPRIKREPAQKDEQANRKNTERVQVAVYRTHQNLKSTLDFEWPEFTTEHARIKAYSQRYKNEPIPKIFGVDRLEEETPVELRVGDKLPLKIAYVTADSVVFNTHKTKQVVNSAINLFKYPNIKNGTLLNQSLEAEVVRVNKENIYVDVIKPIFDRVMEPVLKDPDIQRNLIQPYTVEVKNLQLTRGGFVGQAVIPQMSAWLGQDYTVEAFIPGSQIVLNIEDDFEKWNGQTVKAFITNYSPKPGTKNEMSLICSRKELLKFNGDLTTIEYFKAFCEGNENWKRITEQTYLGVVTGIINSSKKCGVFVELPGLNITGMLMVDPEKLVDYKPKDKLQVKIAGFEENTYFDPMTQQMRHDLPYVIEDNTLKSCDVKVLLKLA